MAYLICIKTDIFDFGKFHPFTIFFKFYPNLEWYF
jgi:hypothetical protein